MPNQLSKSKKDISVLVVDDEGIMRNLLADVLQDEGYSVLTAVDGEEAIKISNDSKFDIVITDLKMPGINGIEVLKKFKSINSNSCIIVITAYASVESAVEAMKEGAYDYVTKPFNIDEIKLIVNRAVERQSLIKEANEKEHYKELSILDGLTDIYNHRYFHEELEQEAERAQRYKLELSLIIIDIDDFKIYNDKHGHLAGDQALKKMARIFNEVVRKVDIVARYGGEEFTIILPQTAKAEALVFAQRIRSLVNQMEFPDKDGNFNVHISVSIGVSTYPADASGKKELISKADEALYDAKNKGKNRICFYNEKGQIDTLSS